MRKLIVAFIVAMGLTLGVAVPALAEEGTSACSGLEVAHDQIHGSGTKGEMTLHDLRSTSNCGEVC